MVEYVDNGDIAIYNGHSFVRDKRNNYYLSSKPILNGRRLRLHVYIWIIEKGEIPEGMQVHHKDHNKKNNCIDNFELLAMGEHSQYHRKNESKELKQLKVQNLALNARPKASEWHGSQTGRKWHGEHAKKIWENRKPQKYICTYCGNPFESLNPYSQDENKFCHNKCKSSYRRKMGLDNITRKCDVCGNEYETNKYSPKKYCSDICKSKMRKANK